MSITRAIAVLLLMLVAAGPVAGADVSFEVSSRQAYVGAPIEYRVVIHDADGADPVPAAPQVVNGRIVSGPQSSQFSSTQIVNGRVTKSRRVTYTWSIRPLAPGRMVITPAVALAGGKKFSGDPIAVAVVESDSGDLLFVEILADRSEIYLGEPLDLRLRIWLKPYRDRRFTLSEGDMWTRIDDQASQWGVFESRLRELASGRRRPGGREVLRDDDDGRPRSYFLYEIPITAWPERSGPFDAGGVEIVVKYPLRLQRDVFDLRVIRDRPVIVAPEPPQVTVVAPPEPGRPQWFTGAVGRFDFDVTARPTEVAVGDPITITLNIRDLTEGRAQMEFLRPPPLARVPELVDRFRMPTDPLAGEVTGRSKRFSQTLRARSDDVDAIPPIPFSYFDPGAGAYVTVHSAAIPLVVEPAAVMSMTDVVGGQDAAAAPTELTEVNTGLLANALDAGTLLVPAATRPPAWWGLVLLAPPLAFGVTVITHRRVDRARHDRRWVRRRRARREALRRVAAAGRADAAELADLVGAAVSGYVADRCNLPAGATTRAEVAGALRDGGVDADVVADVETLLAECEAARYGGGPGGDDGLVERATRAIDRLERERLR